MYTKTGLVSLSKQIVILLSLSLVISCTDNLNQDQSSTGSGRELPPVPAIVDKARDLIRDDYPEAASYRTVMGGDPAAYAWYNYDSQEIELTSLWVKLAHKDFKRGACIIVHEWGHSLYYDQADATKLEQQCVTKI